MSFLLHQKDKPDLNFRLKTVQHKNTLNPHKQKILNNYISNYLGFYITIALKKNRTFIY